MARRKLIAQERENDCSSVPPGAGTDAERKWLRNGQQSFRERNIASALVTNAVY
jgi:hypothetical protein